jgi:hypothetical protein
LCSGVTIDVDVGVIVGVMSVPVGVAVGVTVGVAVGDAVAVRVAVYPGNVDVGVGVADEESGAAPAQKPPANW